MGIRKITFDNGDIVLAKDQAILYDLLLKQQTKTLLPNGETIYQNSTGFLIQNESEKLTYTHKTTNKGVELTFNPQLYLSICGRIIKLEKDTKYFFDWNNIENNETYYIIVKVDLSKEAKIINGELKEFGNPVEVKLINTKSKLTQENLNQKPNDGIYEFPLISFKAKFKKDIYDFETIENIKDESTYLLPLLIESTCNPSKLLTITQKIQEEKELLQEKQNQLKNIKNYLTNLEYRKIEELKELETYIKNSTVYELEHFTRVYPSYKPFSTVDNKCYVAIWRGDKNDDWRIVKFKHSNGQKVVDKYDKYKLISSNDEKDLFNLFILKGFASYFWLKKDDGTRFKSVYRWDGIDDPKILGKTIYFFELVK